MQPWPGLAGKSGNSLAVIYGSLSLSRLTSLAAGLIGKQGNQILISQSNLCIPSTIKTMLMALAHEGFPAGLSRPGKSREGPGIGRDRT